MSHQPRFLTGFLDVITQMNTNLRFIYTKLVKQNHKTVCFKTKPVAFWLLLPTGV